MRIRLPDRVRWYFEPLRLRPWWNGGCDWFGVRLWPFVVEAYWD